MLSDLYTAIMERIYPLLLENWQLFIIFVGLLFLLGGIFNWKWTWDPAGQRPFGFQANMYRWFGEKGVRISTSFTGLMIMICGAAFWFLW